MKKLTLSDVCLTIVCFRRLSYESMSPSATLRVEGKSDPISSCLYDIIYGEDEITMPMDAVKDELVQHSWKIDSPLVKVR